MAPWVARETPCENDHLSSGFRKWRKNRQDSIFHLSVGNNSHNRHLYRDRLSQGGIFFFGFFRFFSGPLGPKTKDSGSLAGTSFFAMFFCGRMLAESPGNIFPVDFPAGSGTEKIFDIFPKSLDTFLELLPPKMAESGPGTVTSFFPTLFSCPGSCGEPGRPLSSQETPIWAPETLPLQPRPAHNGPGNY